jgi:hypothetical protein
MSDNENPTMTSNEESKNVNTPTEVPDTDPVYPVTLDKLFGSMLEMLKQQDRPEEDEDGDDEDGDEEDETNVKWDAYRGLIQAHQKLIESHINLIQAFRDISSASIPDEE